MRVEIALLQNALANASPRSNYALSPKQFFDNLFTRTPLESTQLIKDDEPLKSLVDLSTFKIIELLTKPMSI